VSGLAGGLAVGLVFELAGGLAVGLAFGLAFGLAVGLNAFLTSVDIEQRAISPVTSVRGARRHQAVVGLTFGLTFGLTVGLVFGLTDGLTVGLVFGLAVGLVATLDSASTAFHLAVGLRAAQGQLPWRVMGFLDDAYRLGLLRVVGPVYQFRHAELQDHLAPPHPSPVVVAADPATPS